MSQDREETEGNSRTEDTDTGIEDEEDLTRFNKIAIQGIPQMAVD